MSIGVQFSPGWYALFVAFFLAWLTLALFRRKGVERKDERRKEEERRNEVARAAWANIHLSRRINRRRPGSRSDAYCERIWQSP
jgi:hypothetical protein